MRQGSVLNFDDAFRFIRFVCVLFFHLDVQLKIDR